MKQPSADNQMQPHLEGSAGGTSYMTICRNMSYRNMAWLSQKTLEILVAFNENKVEKIKLLIYIIWI